MVKMTLNKSLFLPRHTPSKFYFCLILFLHILFLLWKIIFTSCSSSSSFSFTSSNCLLSKSIYLLMILISGICINQPPNIAFHRRKKLARLVKSKIHNVNILLTHFFPKFLFYPPMKTSENLRFSNVFRRDLKGISGRNGLIH